MYTSAVTAAAILGLSTVSSARPTRNTTNSTGTEHAFKFPLANAFPDIQNPSPQLDQIQQDALGTLPKAAANAPMPNKPQPDSLTSLAFVAFNELFEVAFFSDLITNITTGAPGFRESDLDLLGQTKDDILTILTTVLAQEELHELNANGAFEKFTGSKIQPCQYIFPVSNFRDAITLASTFTDVVLGTLPDIQTIFANDNDNGLIRGVGSVIGQEGEQNGFYRRILGKNPSALPFLTASARDFAFSAINQNFVVPGSCPSLEILEQGGLKIFDVLTVVDAPTEPKNQVVEFSFKTSKTNNVPVPGPAGAHSLVAQQSFLTYVNQQNAPVSVAIEDPRIGDDGAVHFTAEFPGEDNEMNGLTIAAVTIGRDFVDVDAVAEATLFGPGLIEIN